MRRVLGALVLLIAIVSALLLLRARSRRDHAHEVAGSAARNISHTNLSHAREKTRPLYLSNVNVSSDTAAAAGVIEGSVLASGDGKPIAHALLWFFSGAGYEVAADDNGHFRFAPPAPGVYELDSVTAKGFAPFVSEPGHSGISFNARPGVKLDGVVIYLTGERRYTIVVRDPKGAPAAGAEVRAFSDERGRQGASSATTDKKGEAQLAAADFDVIEATKAGFARARGAIDFVAQATGRVVLTLGSGHDPAVKSIAGRVVDGAGQGVDEALVEALTRRGDRSGARTVSDATGHFTLSELDDGEYTLRASANGRGSVEKTGVAAGTQDLELRLSSKGGIRGAVSDGHGKVVPGFTVVAWPRIGSMGRGDAVESTTFAGDGRYELMLPPGDYVVRAAAHGFAPAAEQSITVGGELITVDFTLARGGRVFGRVVDRQSGAAIAGARVLLEGVGIGSLTLASDTVSDGSGGFAIGGVSAGRQSLEVQAAGHNGRIVSGIEVPADGDVGPLDIDLRALADGEEPKLELQGIGAVITADPSGLLIRDALAGGGAADAGLVGGDIILAIDGTTAEQLGFPAAIQMLRGPEGSTVNVTVRHVDGSTATYVVTRRRLNG